MISQGAQGGQGVEDCHVGRGGQVVGVVSGGRVIVVIVVGPWWPWWFRVLGWSWCFCVVGSV